MAATRSTGPKKIASRPRPGAKVWTLAGESGVTVHRMIMDGLPAGEVAAFEARSGLPGKTIRGALRLSPRLAAARKLSGRLSPDESERLHRLGMVFAAAVEFFDGGTAAARRWFEAPCRGLGQMPPIEMARTEAGGQAVVTLLGRLSHGVFT